MPSAARPVRKPSANASSPTRPTMVTAAPSRAAITAWFAPLPPEPICSDRPASVSPGRGKRSQRNVRSTLHEPTTTTGGGWGDITLTDHGAAMRYNDRRRSSYANPDSGGTGREQRLPRQQRPAAGDVG